MTDSTFDRRGPWPPWAAGGQRLVRRHYGFDLDELDVRTRDWMRKAVEAGG